MIFYKSYNIKGFQFYTILTLKLKDMPKNEDKPYSPKGFHFLQKKTKKSKSLLPQGFRPRKSNILEFFNNRPKPTAVLGFGRLARFYLNPRVTRRGQFCTARSSFFPARNCERHAPSQGLAYGSDSVPRQARRKRLACLGHSLNP